MSALILTLVLAPGQPADPLTDVLRRGEAAYADGLRDREGGGGREAFAEAARCYEELRARGRRNPLLYRNLGNAYLLSGDLPRAILIYRLGLRLGPDDAALRGNLARARERVVYVEGSAVGRPPDDLRPAWLLGWGPLVTFAAAAVLSLLGWGCLARGWMVRRGAYLAAAVVLLTAAAAASWLALRQGGRPARPVAVIARDGVMLRRGDDAAYPPRYPTPLNRGVEVEVLHQREGWVLVELTGGEVGWVSLEEAAVGEE